MAAVAARSGREPAGSQAQIMWREIAAHSPQMASTMTRYLIQAGTFLAPLSVEVADNTLRQLARFLHANTTIVTVGEIRRDDIEAFKVWLAGQPGNRPGTTLSFNTQRQRLGMLRVFFERIIEWEWDDTPRRNPVIGRDLPPRPDPLPKFLDDRDAAKLMAAARASNDPRDRLIVELLARTGMRASEVCDLAADAVVLIGDGHWLRVPIGKLRNDRYVPLHPDLIALLTRWTADNLDHMMAKLRREAHARMLGNGLCTRPVELDCRLESACETCSYFATGPAFIPVLLRQRDHARDHQQPERADLFDGLINRAQQCP